MSTIKSQLSAQDIKTLCDKIQKNNYIDPSDYDHFNIKRGLRNSDGTGVMAGITNVCTVEGYYIDDKTLQIWSFKNNNKNGKLMKGKYDKGGYLRYHFFVNGKDKKIYYHVIIVKMFIKSDYDSNKEQIDHCDHNRTNNSFENLCVVSKSENQRNKSSMNEKLFNFVDNIGNYLVINE